MAASWAALSSGRMSVRSQQALTEAAPAGVGDGVALNGVAAIVPVIHAPQGQTFLGGGFLRAYCYFEQLGAWYPASTADYDLADAAGKSDYTLPALPTAQQNGRFALIADGVTLSGGAQITLELIVTDRAGFAS